MKLFKKLKPTEQKQLLDLLKFVVNATRSDAGGAAVPKTYLDKIEKNEPGLLSAKSGAEVDPAGNILVYATSKGVAAILGDEAATQPAASAESASSEAVGSQFKLETGIPLPVSHRGGPKASVYPFAQMQVGQSFFVPATADKDNPAKALASTCSSASKRYAAFGRKFVVRKITEDGKVTGARCFCIAATGEQGQQAAA